MSSEADIILTPLMGGKEEGGVCSLLEVGGFRILLDCGSTIATENERLLEIASTLRVGGGIDCVIISHADTHHMGGLPVIFGDQGLSPVPVVCSLPVAKFGTMLLYDMQLNVEMEGRPADDEEEGAENQKSGEGGRISYPRFTLDDIDNCLSRVVPLKYSQTIDLNTLLYSGRRSTNMEDEEDEDELNRRIEASKISLCACNSGRTIGGSAWNIRYGSTDVVYLMDFNLKKEVVVDVAALESLPHSPSLLIVNGDCTSHKDVKVAATAGRKRKESSSSSSSTSASGEAASLTGLVMETLRNRGSVLIPCETSARSLELFQLLGRFWAEQKLGLDHLVFLSPMAHNILEYARSQLEWMTDSMSTQFFNGKANPFELPPLKIATSIRELEKAYPGPKVVIATDGALACGLAKELLLRWGGNPLCRVLFLDYPDEGTPAAALKRQMELAAKVVEVTRPQKVELAGEELLQFRRDAEEKRRVKEEALQQSLREQELALLTAVKGTEEDSDDDDNDDKGGADQGDDDEDDDDDMDVEKGDGINSNSNTPTAKKARQERLKEKERRKNNTARQSRSKIAKFAQPIFTMFESYEKTQGTVVGAVDAEYGVGLDDLRLAEMAESMDPAGLSTAKGAVDKLMNGMNKGGGNNSAGGGDADAMGGNGTDMNGNEQPWKIVSSLVKLQFTCDFKNVPLSGRADVRAVKAVVSQLNPLNLCLLRGSETDIEATAQAVRGQDRQVSAPGNGESVSVRALPDRICLTIPPELMPPAMYEINDGDGDAAGPGGGGGPAAPPCLVSAVKGAVEEVSNKNGLRRVRLAAPADEGEGEEEKKKEEEESELLNQGYPDEFGVKTAEPVCGPGAALDLQSAREPVAVSVGEVSLSSLKASFERAGLQVESVTAKRADGGMSVVLVLDGQVTVRLDDDGVNGLLIEGAPVPAYWQARKIVYSRFAFLMC